MRPEAQAWMRQSEADWQAAQGMRAAGFYFMVAFNVHQAVEKILKAAVVELRREIPPRTHNLVELGRLLGVPEDIAALLRRLNPEYTISRYPDAANGIPAEQYDAERADELLHMGERVIEWTRSALMAKD